LLPELFPNCSFFVFFFVFSLYGLSPQVGGHLQLLLLLLWTVNYNLIVSKEWGEVL
jgi:hypothetical protein